MLFVVQSYFVGLKFRDCCICLYHQCSFCEHHWGSGIIVTDVLAQGYASPLKSHVSYSFLSCFWFRWRHEYFLRFLGIFQLFFGIFKVPFQMFFRFVRYFSGFFRFFCRFFFHAFSQVFLQVLGIFLGIFSGTFQFFQGFCRFFQAFSQVFLQVSSQVFFRYFFGHSSGSFSGVFQVQSETGSVCPWSLGICSIDCAVTLSGLEMNIFWSLGSC